MAIRIESFPVSSGGVCTVGYGQPVTFTITSGYTTESSFQWYLNGDLVSVGSGYTLSPSQFDDIYIKIQCNECHTIKLVDYTDPPSLYNAGTLRYRKTSNSSSLDVCMQTDANTYTWWPLKTYSW
jgi:hypothetical protein